MNTQSGVEQKPITPPANPAHLGRKETEFTLSERVPNASPTMDATAANGASIAHNQEASPNGTSKLSHHSPGDDDHEVWSAGEDESGEDGGRSMSGSKRKREKLSVSCETCKQRKVKCDRGHPACKSITVHEEYLEHVLMLYLIGGWCLKNHSTCVS